MGWDYAHNYLLFFNEKTTPHSYYLLSMQQTYKPHTSSFLYIFLVEESGFQINEIRYEEKNGTV